MLDCFFKHSKLKCFSGFISGRFRVASLFTVAAALFAVPLQSQTAVTTWRNDIARTGRNSRETILTPANVKASSFGRLFSLPVDGAVYAQPLYVPNLQIPGKGVHNVLFVATQHDSVYAFDAGSNTGENSRPLWQISLISADHGATLGAMPVSSDELGHDIIPEVGITGTPVIDLASKTLYVVAKWTENGGVVQRLHALDILTGNERPNSPVEIRASSPGSGSGSVDGVITFDKRWENNRPGLLLLNGIVYLGYGSHGDNGPWHGWILAYDGQTLQQTGAYNPTPNGIGSGFWMAGAGLAADVADPVNHPFGRMFVSTGNGSFNATPPFNNSQNFSDDILNLDLANGKPSIADSFTPFTEEELNWSDEDLGSGGVLLLPDQTTGAHRRLLVQSGKQGIIYLVDRDNMGGFTPGRDNIVQEIRGQIQGLWSTPAYWSKHVYFAGANDKLKAFTLTDGQLSWTPSAVSPDSVGYPGASPAISANAKENAIVWMVDSSGFTNDAPAVLTAHDANDVASLLYSSSEVSDRDNPGAAVKFVVPTVADGKVYVGAAGQVSVFGLMHPGLQAAAPTFSPGPQSFSGSLEVSIADATPGAIIYYTLDGSAPNQSSPVYGGPVVITGDTTINAVAAAPGVADSSHSTASYRLANAENAIDFGTGFSNALQQMGGNPPMTFNGSSRLDDTRLQLTDGGYQEAGSAFYSTAVNIRSFKTDFTFQLSNAAADGFTFTLQGQGANALGGSGGALGYSEGERPGLQKSVAIKFDLYNNGGEGFNSTGLYVNGAAPYFPSIDLTRSGIDLHSGSTIRVNLTYDGKTLAMKMTDQVTSASWFTQFDVDIPGIVGGDSAFAGFTGGTGGERASQKILTWIFQSSDAGN